MLSIISHAVCQQAGIQLGDCVSQSDRLAILDIQWLLLLVQEHRPTLLAARRCAASHVAEHKEIMDGSEEFFWQVHQDLIRYAVLVYGLAPGKAPEFLQESRLVFLEL